MMVVVVILSVAVLACPDWESDGGGDCRLRVLSRWAWRSSWRWQEESGEVGDKGCWDRPVGRALDVPRWWWWD
ncbi:putative ankyrin repeat-containing protein [Iris pallida]|nr:putative ankyrin repeat-containing protein [Iris pallida]